MFQGDMFMIMANSNYSSASCLPLQFKLFKTHSHFSEWRTGWHTHKVSVQSLISSVSLCHASSRCACSFLFVLVSVFLIHRAPAVMALGSSCWRAVGSAGIMDREVSNVTADWQLTGGEERDAIAALCI